MFQALMQQILHSPEAVRAGIQQISDVGCRLNLSVQARLEVLRKTQPLLLQDVVMEGESTAANFLKSWAPPVVAALVVQQRDTDLALAAAQLGAHLQFRRNHRASNMVPRMQLLRDRNVRMCGACWRWPIAKMSQPSGFGSSPLLIC